MVQAYVFATDAKIQDLYIVQEEVSFKKGLTNIYEFILNLTQKEGEGSKNRACSGCGNATYGSYDGVF